MNDFTLKNQFTGARLLLIASWFCSGKKDLYLGFKVAGKILPGKLIKSLLSSIKRSLIYRQYLVFFVFGP